MKRKKKIIYIVITIFVILLGLVSCSFLRKAKIEDNNQNMNNEIVIDNNEIVEETVDEDEEIIDDKVVEEIIDTKKHIDFTAYKYWVVFYDSYGNELQRTVQEYGSMPKYNGTLPEGFVSWDKEILPIITNTYYHAVCVINKTEKTSKVCFDANGGSGIMPEIAYSESNNCITIPSGDTLTNGNKVVVGWSTNKNYVVDNLNKSAYYQPGLSYPFSVNEIPTLYAIWAEPNESWTAIYKDTEIIENADKTYTYPINFDIKLLDNPNNWYKYKYSIIGYKYLGANHLFSETKTVNYSVQTTVTFNPIWQGEKYTIIYHDVGYNKSYSGNETLPDVYYYGDVLRLDNMYPTKDNYKFNGWSNYNFVMFKWTSMFYMDDRIDLINTSNVENIANANNEINLYAHWEQRKLIFDIDTRVQIDDLTNTSWILNYGDSEIGEFSSLDIKKNDIKFIDEYGMSHSSLTLNDNSVFYFDDQEIYAYNVGSIENIDNIYITGGNRTKDKELIDYFKKNANIVCYPGTDINDLYAFTPMYDETRSIKVNIPVCDGGLDKEFRGYDYNGSLLLKYDQNDNSFSFDKSVSGVTDKTNWTFTTTGDDVILTPNYEEVSYSFQVYKGSSINWKYYKGCKKIDNLVDWAASKYNNLETNGHGKKIYFIENNGEYYLGFIEGDESKFTKLSYQINGVDVYQIPSEGFYQYYIFDEDKVELSNPIFTGENIPLETVKVYLPNGWDKQKYEEVDQYRSFKTTLIDSKVWFQIGDISCYTDVTNNSLIAWAKKYAPSLDYGLGHELCWIDVDGTEYLGYFYIGQGEDKQTTKEGIKEYNLPSSEYGIKYIPVINTSTPVNNTVFIYSDKNNLVNFTIGSTNVNTDTTNADLLSWARLYSASQAFGKVVWINNNGVLYLGHDEYPGLLEKAPFTVNNIDVYSVLNNEAYKYSIIDGNEELASPIIQGSGAEVIEHIYLPSGWNSITNGQTFQTTEKNNIINFKIGSSNYITSSENNTLLKWVKSKNNIDGYKFVKGYGTTYTYLLLSIPEEDAHKEDYTVAGIDVYAYDSLAAGNVIAISGTSLPIDDIKLVDEIIPSDLTASVILDTTTISEGTSFNVTSSTYTKAYSTCVSGDTLITLDNGEKIEVRDLDVNDQIQTFDHRTGELSSSKVAYIYKNVGNYKVLTLNFEDGNNLEIIVKHGLYNLEENKYVIIEESNIDNYVGKHFYNTDSNSYVELISYTIDTKETDIYSIISEYDINHVANGLLAMSDDIEGIYNVFEYDENMMIKEDEKNHDIERYGLLDYAMFKDCCSEDEFNIYNIQYINIAIEKGLTTLDSVISRMKYYLVR